MTESEPKKEPIIIDRANLRQNLYLVEQASVGGLPVVPGNGWKNHYPTDAATREVILQGLIEGTLEPDRVADQLKPDGLTYDVAELELSLSSAISKVKDKTANIAHYNYQRFAHFIAGMRDTGIDATTAGQIYDHIVKSRTRNALLETYGYTGRQQIGEAMRQDAAKAISGFSSLPSGERIFEALKLNWAAQDLMLVPATEAQEVIDQLDETERKFFDAIQDPYRKFVQSGSATSFDSLTQAVRSHLESHPAEPEPETPSQEESRETEEESPRDNQGEGKGQGRDQQGIDQGQGSGGTPGPEGLGNGQGTPQKEGSQGQPGPQQPQTPPQSPTPAPDQQSQEPTQPPVDQIEKPKEEQKDYSQEISKEMEENAGPPPPPENPAPPPDFNEETKIEKNRGPQGVYYYITPAGTSTAPMIGHFARVKKSRFDEASKTWRGEASELTAYIESITGTGRQTIASAGQISGNLGSIPLPTNYAPDMSSLQYQGARPEIFRDQHGCFYIKAAGPCSFSIDFLKEPQVFADQPAPDDLKPLYKGELSVATEAFLKTLQGSNIDMATALGAYIDAHHFYIADGNLDAAQALKYRFSQVPIAEYFQAIDASKYHDCTLSHTLFVGILRKLGIPTRVVSGDNVNKVINDRAQIDSNTPHLWAEVWNGGRWVKFDITPSPEHPENQDQEPSEGQQAEDNSADQSSEGEEGQEGQEQQGEKPKEGQKGRNSRPDMKFKEDTQQGEATDEDMQSGKESLQKALETMNKIKQAKDKLDRSMQKPQSFQDLEKIKQQAEQADIFDDMKNEIQEKIKALEKAKKDQLRETIEEMGEDGFIKESEKERLLQQLDNGKAVDFDKVEQKIKVEGKLFNEYQEIKARVEDKVDEWFEWVVERLPKEPEVSYNEAILRRKGRLDRRSMMKPINLIMGTVKNPRELRESTKPMFLASIVVDFSRSVMTMDPAKRKATEEILVFYCELFDKIVQQFGYMRFEVTAFHDKVYPIKPFDHDYSSTEEYEYVDKAHSTVKARLMRTLHTEGGTYILPALKDSARALNKEAFDHPDFLSAFYFIGDGQDSHGDTTHTTRIRRFVENINPENGFGDHLRSAIFMGDEEERRQLANIFGNEHTTVCSDFDQLIKMAMLKFDEDVQYYMGNRTA